MPDKRSDVLSARDEIASLDDFVTGITWRNSRILPLMRCRERVMHAA
jgi:hypothetical protein